MVKDLEQLYVLGEEHYNKKEYEKAVNIFKEAAAEGHAKSQYFLSTCYYLGEGVKKDIEQSIKWLLKAAYNGCKESFFNLGESYSKGNAITPQNFKEAVNWYEKSAYNNDPSGQNALGDCYFYGKGVTQDYKKAFYWYEIAANQGHNQAMLSLSNCYENGYGVHCDYDKSLFWLNKIEKSNDGEVQFRKGMIFLHKMNQPIYGLEQLKRAYNKQNINAAYQIGIYYENRPYSDERCKAIEWFEKVKDLNDEALYKAAMGYKYGTYGVVDYSKALDYFKRLADKNYTKSYVEIGELYYDCLYGMVDDDKAFYWFDKGYKCNDLRATAHLGRCYYDGQGTNIDIPKSIQLIKFAADKEEPNGQRYLGILYEVGVYGYIEKDLNIAEELYGKAAEQDCFKAKCDFAYVKLLEGKYTHYDYKLKQLAFRSHYYPCYLLGYCYYYGIGVSRDYKIAKIELEKAASKFYSPALTLLGGIYYNGYGVSKDYNKAFEYYRKAANYNDPDALNMLGIMYKHGEGVNVDFKKSISYFEKASSYGSYASEYNLGNMYLDGDKVTKDSNKALMYLEKSAASGYTEAMNRLGYIYYKGLGGVPINHEKSIYWYEQGANNNDSDSEYGLGLIYSRGINGKKYPEKSIYWFKKSAENGNSTGQYLLGNIYENGFSNLVRDTSKAIYWYSMAAKQGLGEAKESLKKYGLCQYCGGKFTGVFTKKCSVCGKNKDY